MVERFQREAMLAAQLTHPNIAQVHTIGSKDEIHYVAMEFIGGGDVSSLLKQKKRIPVDEAAEIVRQSLLGLGSAHAEGIIHRDIKPQNLMLSAHGLVKVSDFGLARAIASDSSLTASGAVLGTPLYMSPEQGEGKPVDGRTDIYSLGASFYHLICGRPPFEGDTPVTVMLKHLTAPVPSPRELDPDIPEEICDIINKMMAKQPDDRYQTCEEVLADLEPYCQAHPAKIAAAPIDRGLALQSRGAPEEVDDKTAVVEEQQPSGASAPEASAERQRSQPDAPEDAAPQPEVDRDAPTQVAPPDLAKKAADQAEPKPKKKPRKPGTKKKAKKKKEEPAQPSPARAPEEEQALRAAQTQLSKSHERRLGHGGRRKRTALQEAEARKRLALVGGSVLAAALVIGLIYVFVNREPAQRPGPVRRPTTSTPTTAPAVTQVTDPEEQPAPRPSWMNGCVLAYSFSKDTLFDQDGNTWLRDISGSGNDGLIYGAQLVPGVVSEGFSFNGKDNVVEVQKPVLPSEKGAAWSMAAWFRTANPRQNGAVLAQYYELTNGIVALMPWELSHVYQHDPVKKMEFSFGPPKANEAHFIAVACDGKTMRVYLDGQRAGEGELHVPVPPKKFCVGSWRRGWGWYEGMIDEVAVWQRELSATEIASLLAYSKTGKSYCEAIGRDRTANPDPRWADGCVLACSFDGNTLYEKDGKRRVRDLSGRGHDGEFVGSRMAEGHSGESVHLSGKGDHVTLGHLAALNFGKNQAFTYMAWVRPAGGNDDGRSTIMGKLDGSPGGAQCGDLFQFDVKAGHFIWEGVCGPRREFDTRTKVAWLPGRWHLAAVTYDGSGLTAGSQLYFNGEPVEMTRARPAEIPGEIRSNADFRVGGRNHKYGGAQYFFAGEIDETAVWNRALSAQEIKALHDYSKAGKSYCEAIGEAVPQAAGRHTVYTQWPFDAAEAKRRQNETATALGLPVEYIVELPDDNRIKLHLIPAGEFTMGASKELADEMFTRFGDVPAIKSMLTSAQPPHRVRITRLFLMATTEVTQTQYQKAMGKNPAANKAPNKPVEEVSWHEAKAFCKWLNENDAGRPKGHEYRLPTEAEWEYAARAGSTGRYSCGDDEKALDAYAWHGGNSAGPREVATKRPNHWGLYDMHGNVWEWVEDAHAPDLYSKSPDADPLNTRGTNKVLRGGGSNTIPLWPAFCLASSRHHGPPTGQWDDIGFRVVLAPVGKAPAYANSLGMEFMCIPAGEFMMGSTQEEIADLLAEADGWALTFVASEVPRHRVRIRRDFLMGRFEVTRGQYRRFVEATGYVTVAEKDGGTHTGFQGKWQRVADCNWRKPYYEQTDDHPVVCLAFADTQAFCGWLNQHDAKKPEGFEYRLPTEAEWEYAARGPQSLRYPWGNDWNGTKANWADKSSGLKDERECDDGFPRSSPVGSYSPRDASPFGVSDLVGNAGEWCLDWYDAQYYPQSPVDDPVNVEAGNTRAVRSGDFGSPAPYCHPTRRWGLTIDSRHWALGFRLVLAPVVIRNAEQLNGALRAKNPAYNGRGRFKVVDDKIVEAHLANTGLADLSALGGLPLSVVDLRFCREVSDLSPLKGARLASLVIQGSKVRDLASLTGMPLQSLDVSECRELESVSGIEGAPLTRLTLHSCPKLKSIDALAGMKLTAANVEGCSLLTDISALRGMPLTYLKISGTQVTDLTPIKGAPLNHVHLEDTKVTDVTPLAGSPIEKLIFNPKNITKGLEVIRNMKTIKEIGRTWDERTTPAEFWKNVQ